jgi:uncharacterized membrane protein required for colicin V production
LNVNVFDILIVALPIAFLLLGFLHTGWREFLSLLGVAVGAALGGLFGGRLAEIIARVLPEKDLAGVIAFLLILAGGWALGGILGGMAERLQSGSRSESNRILPAVFGALKGGVLDLALVWLVDRHISAFHTPLRNANLTGYAHEALSWLSHHSPL